MKNKIKSFDEFVNENYQINEKTNLYGPGDIYDAVNDILSTYSNNEMPDAAKYRIRQHILDVYDKGYNEFKTKHDVEEEISRMIKKYGVDSFNY